MQSRVISKALARRFATGAPNEGLRAAHPFSIDRPLRPRPSPTASPLWPYAPFHRSHAAATRPALQQAAEAGSAAAPAKGQKYNVDATNFEIAPSTIPWKGYKNEYFEKRGYKVAPKEWKVSAGLFLLRKQPQSFVQGSSANRRLFRQPGRCFAQWAPRIFFSLTLAD